jgi:RNA polymerase sigma-70 factor (ECF subfamily)
LRRRGKFFAALVDGVQPLTAERLMEDDDSGRVLRHALERAVESHPGFGVDLERFTRFLAPRLDGAGDPTVELGGLRTPDLYLGFACLEQDPLALEWLSDVGFPAIEDVLRPLAVSPEDVRQATFIKVFLGSETSPPKIHDYGGRGSLLKWLQVVAYRLGQNVLRDQSREALIDPAAVDRLMEIDQGHEELRYIKELYRGEFDEAFQESLGALSAKQRQLLHRRLIQAESVQQIAAAEGVHRMTVTRWFNAIRHQLLETTKARLSERLGTDADDTSSMVRTLRGSLDTSLRSFLRRRRRSPAART